MVHLVLGFHFSLSRRRRRKNQYCNQSERHWLIPLAVPYNSSWWGQIRTWQTVSVGYAISPGWINMIFVAARKDFHFRVFLEGVAGSVK